MTTAKRPRRLPERVADAMTAILDYLWQDEAKDYLSRGRDEQCDHIFQEMLAVRQWLDGRDSHSGQKSTHGKKRSKVTIGKLLT